MILCRKALAKAIDKAVFPGLQGGPHMNAVAGVAITLGRALTPEFRAYSRLVIRNSRTLATELLDLGGVLVTGGTDNHMMVLDTVKSFDVDGRVAEETLDAVSMTVNKQLIPDDPKPPMRPSGIRLGTPAATTRGLVEEDMKTLGGWIVDALEHADDEAYLSGLRATVEDFCSRYPVPGLP